MSVHEAEEPMMNTNPVIQGELPANLVVNGEDSLYLGSDATQLFESPHVHSVSDLEVSPVSYSDVVDLDIFVVVVVIDKYHLNSILFQPEEQFVNETSDLHCSVSCVELHRLRRCITNMIDDQSCLYTRSELRSLVYALFVMFCSQNGYESMANSISFDLSISSVLLKDVVVGKSYELWYACKSFYDYIMERDNCRFSRDFNGYNYVFYEVVDGRGLVYPMSESRSHVQDRKPLVLAGKGYSSDCAGDGPPKSAVRKTAITNKNSKPPPKIKPMSTRGPANTSANKVKNIASGSDVKEKKRTNYVYCAGACKTAWDDDVPVHYHKVMKVGRADNFTGNANQTAAVRRIVKKESENICFAKCTELSVNCWADHYHPESRARISNSDVLDISSPDDSEILEDTQSSPDQLGGDANYSLGNIDCDEPEWESIHIVDDSVVGVNPMLMAAAGGGGAKLVSKVANVQLPDVVLQPVKLSLRGKPTLGMAPIAPNFQISRLRHLHDGTMRPSAPPFPAPPPPTLPFICDSPVPLVNDKIEPISKKHKIDIVDTKPIEVVPPVKPHVVSVSTPPTGIKVALNPSGAITSDPLYISLDTNVNGLLVGYMGQPICDVWRSSDFLLSPDVMSFFRGNPNVYIQPHSGVIGVGDEGKCKFVEIYTKTRTPNSNYEWWRGTLTYTGLVRDVKTVGNKHSIGVLNQRRYNSVFDFRGMLSPYTSTMRKRGNTTAITEVNVTQRVGYETLRMDFIYFNIVDVALSKLRTKGIVSGGSVNQGAKASIMKIFETDFPTLYKCGNHGVLYNTAAYIINQVLITESIFDDSRVGETGYETSKSLNSHLAGRG